MTFSSNYTKSDFCPQKYAPFTNVKWLKGTPLAGTTALALLFSLPGFAQEVEIDDERTEAVSTSTADNGAPADLIITEDGSITVDDGPALIIDSDNTVSIDGVLESTQRNGGIGIDIQTGDGLTSGLTLGGNVTLDGDFGDNEDRVGSDNRGVRLSGDGAFTGDILIDGPGVLRVFGTDSIGLDLGTDITGSITNEGTIRVEGEDAIGLAVRGAVSGDVRNEGGISGTTAGGEIGLLIEGPVSGSVLNLGSVVTGRNQAFDQNLDVLPQESGGPAVFISGNVQAGFVNGPDVIPDDPDGPLAGANATIAGRGSGHAVRVSAVNASGNAGNVTLGAFGEGDEAFGFINRATISAESQEADFAATAIRIEGADVEGTIFTTRLEGGLRNARGADITVESIDNAATAVSIGDYADVPAILNGGRISVRAGQSSDDTNSDSEPDSFGPGGDATAISISERAVLQSFSNSGAIAVATAGEGRNAIGVIDRSGTISQFDNSGTIIAASSTNNFGRLVAADLSASSSDISFSNSGTISGDVLLGTGNDNVVMDDGSFAGTFDLGAGINTLSLRNEAVFSGGLRGDFIDLDVSNSEFRTSTAAATRVRNATFSNGATLALSVRGDAQSSGALIASDTVTIGTGTTIDPDFFAFPATAEPLVLVSAQTLELGDSLDNLNFQIGLSSVIFEQSLDLRTGEREELVVNLRRRSADEIGLSERRGALFESSVAGLEGDDSLGAAVANLETITELESALDQIAPESGELPRYTAISNQTMALGILSQRFSSLRGSKGLEFANSERLARAARIALREGREAQQGGLNFWLQEIGYVGNRDTVDDVVGFDGETFGFAAGADYPLFGLDALGFSVMQTVGDYRDDLEGRDEFEVLATQLNLYGSYSAGGFFFDAVATYSFLDFERERIIEFGDLSRTVEGDWGGTQYGGSAQAGYRLEFGRYGLTASGNINYVKLEEDGYTEIASNGSGFIVDDRDTTSLRAGANARFDALFSLTDDLKFRPSLSVGYLTELDDDEIETVARFASGGSDFLTISPVALDDSLVGGVGMEFVTDSVNVTLNYNQERTSDFTSHVGALSVRILF